MSEFNEQKEFIRWFRERYPRYIKSIRLSLNGVNLPAGKKAAIMINQFKSQGMVKSESDLFFAIPSKGYHGLFIELKDHSKKPTDEQIEYLDYMAKLNYKSVWCEGAEEAKKIIMEYLD